MRYISLLLVYFLSVCLSLTAPGIPQLASLGDVAVRFIAQSSDGVVGATMSDKSDRYNRWGIPMTAQASVPPRRDSPEKFLGAGEKSSLESTVLVARVDDNFITQRDVYRRAIVLNTTDHPLVLQTLIEDRVLTAEAIRKGITVSDDEIDAVIKERLSSFKSLDDFEKQILQPLRMTREEYRQDVKEQLLRDKYIRSKIGIHKLTEQIKADFIIDVFISPREIKEYFEANKNRFTRPEKIKTRQIIIMVKPERGRAESKALAESIHKRLQNNEDFETLARQYSDVRTESGGLWDWTEKGTFLPEVEDIIFPLKEGEISPIITTDNNFIIVKVEGRKEFIPSFDMPEIQQEIRERLVNQKINRGVTLIKNKLLKEATIYITEDLKK